MTSQTRYFPNFLEAYQEYSHDKFCPNQFHLWTGISIIAGALERKVSLKQGKIYHTPNLYVMLVSHPGMGKSTAIDVGVDLLEQMRIEHNPNFRIIPNQVTEPAFLDLMKVIEFYGIGPGQKIQIPHSSGYFYASEASASALQNTCGDFVASLTAFYDCPKYFRKKLKGEKDPVNIENACMNVLAGSTFDYLKNLVNEQSVMGGFASRLVYVICKERIVREFVWDAQKQEDYETKRKLTHDLAVINRLAGPFRPTREYISRLEKWQPDFDRFLIALDSPRMESIFARKGTNIIKLSMILSVSEGDSLVLDARHFDEAFAHVEEVAKDNSFIIKAAIMADKQSQSGINQVIGQTLKKHGGTMNAVELRQKVMKYGNDIAAVKTTLDYMLGSGWLSTDGVSIKLLIDPDGHL
jgi:hypothetical protein